MIKFFILCHQEPSADKFCKQFEPSSGPTKSRPDLNSNCLKLNDIVEKGGFFLNKKTADDKNMQNNQEIYLVGKELMRNGFVKKRGSVICLLFPSHHPHVLSCQLRVTVT